jgi:hypothetical protein
VAVRSKRLWGPTAVAASPVVLYTCPVGETALIKQVNVGPGSLGGSIFTLYLGAATAANELAVISIGNNAWALVSDLFIVLHPGDVLRGVYVAAGCRISGFGAELEGVAD